MDATFYNGSAWRALAARAIARDGNRCTVARLLGGPCKGRLHAHHIRRPKDENDELALDLDNLGTACASHHPVWERLRRELERTLGRRVPVRVRCPHFHPYAEGRRICEERLARAAAGA